MLDGTWEVQGARLGDQSIEIPGGKMIVTGDRYVVQTPAGLDEGHFEVDSTVDPVAVDLVGTAGPHAGRRIRAAARLKGDLLQLAYDVGGSSRRPTDFVARGGSSVVAVRYKRVTSGPIDV